MTETNIIIVIILGTLVLFLLTSVFIIFLFLHRKKMVEKEVNFQKLKVKQQRELLHSEINAIEKERRRIARDLHDDVGAMLSLVKMNISQIPKLINQAESTFSTVDTTTSLVDETIADVRRISRDLLPSVLENYGYIEAVKEICNAFKFDAIALKCQIETNVRLSKQAELQLYRVTQEFVNNAVKHAECKHIAIRVFKENNALHIILCDDGKGFDYEKSYAKNSLGLKTIESRLSLIDAKYTFNSDKGKGTKLHIEIDRNNP